MTTPIHYTEDDVHNLKLVSWKEARGEHLEGCRAVMHVVCNRVGKPGFPKDLHSVIYQKNAFSSMSRPSDGEYNLQPAADDALYASLDPLARNVVAGQDTDITKGALYYANLDTMDKDGWFARNIISDTIKHPETVKLGKHTFYL